MTVLLQPPLNLTLTELSAWKPGPENLGREICFEEYDYLFFSLLLGLLLLKCKLRRLFLLNV